MSKEIFVEGGMMQSDTMEDLEKYNLEKEVIYIIDASVKLKCSVITRSKALLIYHYFKRCVHEANYDPYLVAAACISLSTKQNEEPVEFDAIIFAFLSTFGNTTLPDTKRLDNWKKSITMLALIIERMIDFSLSYTLAHQFLPYFMFVFREEVSYLSAWKDFVENCMRIASDFYFTNKCLNYKAEEIASTVVQVSLYLIGIPIGDDCPLKYKIKGLCECEEAKRQDIIYDIFHICYGGTLPT